MNYPIDENSPTHGMPSCLRVPTAASDIASIQKYVGHIENTVKGRDNQIKALFIKPYMTGNPENPQAKLWELPEKEFFIKQLYPQYQVWVHVDYRNYRKAYLNFGMPTPPIGYVLDHIQNRKVIRLVNYKHPYLRLCPVSRSVNASGGHIMGTEGMEKSNIINDRKLPDKWMKRKKYYNSFNIIYADPIDLTKMLNIPTGTKELPGVAKMLLKFYK